MENYRFFPGRKRFRGATAAHRMKNHAPEGSHVVRLQGRMSASVEKPKVFPRARDRELLPRYGYRKTGRVSREFSNCGRLSGKMPFRETDRNISASNIAYNCIATQLRRVTGFGFFRGGRAGGRLTSCCRSKSFRPETALTPPNSPPPRTLLQVFSIQRNGFRFNSRGEKCSWLVSAFQYSSRG